MTGTASLKAHSAMLLKLRQRHLCCALAKNLMAFATADPCALRMDLVGESIIVSLAHCRWRLLVSRSRVTFSAARPSDFFAGFHLFWSLVADVALAVRREGGPRARDGVAARAVGSLIASHVGRVSLVRELQPKGLSLRKVSHRGAHCRYALMTIGANGELRRSEFFDVTRYARRVTGYHRLDGISLSHVTLIALQLVVLRVIEFCIALRSGRPFD